QYRVPGPDHRRLHAYVARPKTRPGAIGSAAVEGDADNGYVEFVRARNVRQPQERRHTRKTWIDQRVHRLSRSSTASVSLHAGMRRIINHAGPGIIRAS